MNLKKHRTAETRSRRVQLVFQPSVYDNLIKVAHIRGKSVNSLINELVTSYIDKKKKDICAYDLFVATFEEE